MTNMRTLSLLTVCSEEYTRNMTFTEVEAEPLFVAGPLNKFHEEQELIAKLMSRMQPSSQVRTRNFCLSFALAVRLRRSVCLPRDACA